MNAIASHGRQRVTCLDSAKCGGAKWHYADSAPVCRGGSGGTANSSPLLASKPAPLSSIEKETSLLTLSSDEWDALVHASGTDLDADDFILDREDFDFIRADIGYDTKADRVEQMTRRTFYEQAAEGRRVFEEVEFVESMGEGETRGMVFSGCRFKGDVTLGDRALLSNCNIDGSLHEPAAKGEGGRVAAIVEGGSVEGDVRLSGTSHVSFAGVGVNGDMHLTGGNGLQAVFIKDPQVGGVIYMDDTDAIVMSNYEYGNIFALHGSAEAMLEAPGHSGGATYHGFAGDEDGDEVPAVTFVSYDDLQESQQAPGQGELDGAVAYSADRFREMDERVDILAREAYRKARGRNY